MIWVLFLLYSDRPVTVIMSSTYRVLSTYWCVTKSGKTWIGSIFSIKKWMVIPLCQMFNIYFGAIFGNRARHITQCFGSVVMICFICLGYCYSFFIHIPIPISERYYQLKVHCSLKGCTCMIMLLHCHHISDVNSLEMQIIWFMAIIGVASIYDYTVQQKYRDTPNFYGVRDSCGLSPSLLVGPPPHI